MSKKVEEIIKRNEELQKKMRFALSTMEKKNSLFEIKKQIIQNQDSCPHFDLEYSWPVIDGRCPYCGRNLEGIL